MSKKGAEWSHDKLFLPYYKKMIGLTMHPLDSGYQQI